MRDDHVQSAVAFLREPQVASAALAKKVGFLESKGLTSEEINEALQQADGNQTAGSSTTPPPPPISSAHASLMPVQQPPRPNYMMQQPPPIPERDWKDYFVMATVSAGVAYGLFQCAKCYVLPMIMPPSPPALEADKEALEAEFQRTEQLLAQLQEDTDAIRKQEEARTKTFDAVMDEARSVIEDLKQHSEERRQESKLALSNVETLRELIPRTLKTYSESQAKAIESLQAELLSLKTLVNRRGAQSGGPAVPPASAVPSSLPGFPRKPKAEPKATDIETKTESKSDNTTSAPIAAAPTNSNESNGTSAAAATSAASPVSAAPAATTTAESKASESFIPDPQAKIPEWQCAAAAK